MFRTPYLYKFGFHLRPGQTKKAALSVGKQKVELTAMGMNSTFPVGWRIRLGGRWLPKKGAITTNADVVSLAVPIKLKAFSMIEVIAENKSEQTRRWNKAELAFNAWLLLAKHPIRFKRGSTMKCAKRPMTR